MNYPRRRAPIACNFCRQRKRKCDGDKPACGLCSAAGAQCSYQDGPSDDTTESMGLNNHNGVARQGPESVNSGPDSINRLVETPSSTDALVRRIGQLEALLSTQHDASQLIEDVEAPRMSPPLSLTNFDASLKDSDSWLPNFLSNMTGPPDFLLDQSVTNAAGSHTAEWDPVDSSQTPEQEPPTIPFRHLTPTSSLFALDPVRRLVGDYPGDYFYQIEAARDFRLDEVNGNLADALSLLDLDSSHTQALLSAFYSEVLPQFPIIEPDSFSTFFQRTMSGDSDDLDIALCLVVLALGELVSNLRHSPGRPTQQDGSTYFAVAYHVLTRTWVSSFDFNLSLASGLVYSAIYLCYLERPLNAWKLIHMASTKLQMMAPQLQGPYLTQKEADCVRRLCWTCFLLECDSLAEFHLPRSGIELVMDNLQFPQFTDGTDPNRLYFLALCSIRRLLNRIHRAIYTIYPASTQGSASSNIGTLWSSSTPSSPFFSVGTLGSVCSELAKQLDNWYINLPDRIRPEFSENNPRSLHDGWLRLRYWSAKHIICRPCLVYAAGLTDHSQLPDYVLTNSELCVESCRNYIHTAAIVLTERTQFTSMTIQGSLACAAMIAISSGNAQLSHLVPDAGDLLQKVIVATQPWASPGSSAESIGWILNTISQKQRMMGTLHRTGFTGTPSVIHNGNDTRS